MSIRISAGRASRANRQPDRTVDGFHDVEPGTAQAAREHVAVHLVVFHQQDQAHGATPGVDSNPASKSSAGAAGRGRLMENVEPRPASLINVTSPPHQLAQSLADGQAEARAAVLPRERTSPPG